MNNKTKSKPKTDKFTKAIIACINNAERLLDDIDYLVGFERYPTAYALCILSQEEYSKAFMLHLVSENIIPWNKSIQKILKDHKCKQLFSLILENLNLEWDEYLDNIQNNIEYETSLPIHIRTALNIIVHERAGDLNPSDWQDKKNSNDKNIARKIAKGTLDKQKQNAIYVALDKDGNIAHNPSNIINAEIAKKEFKKTTRFNELFRITNNKVNILGLDNYKRVCNIFKALFGLQTIEEFNRNYY